jgi:ketosteroid isomerase-like protein
MDGPLELALRLMETLGRGDPDAAAPLLAEDVEWYGSVGGLEPGLARGRDAVIRSFLDYSGTWEGLYFEARSAVVSGGRVLALVTEHARGMGSGVEVEQGTAILFSTKDGMITNVVSYLDLSRAYADFGIDPEAVAALQPGKTYELRDRHAVELPS